MFSYDFCEISENTYFTEPNPPNRRLKDSRENTELRLGLFVQIFRSLLNFDLNTYDTLLLCEQVTKINVTLRTGY